MKKLLSVCIVFMLVGCAAKMPGHVLPGPENINEAKCNNARKQHAETGALKTAEIYCQQQDQRYFVYESSVEYDGPGNADAHETVNKIGSLVSAFGVPGLVRSSGTYMAKVKFGCR